MPVYHNPTHVHTPTNSGGVVSFSGCVNASEMRERARISGPLPIDAQRLIDQRIVQVGVQRLVIVERLIANGLIVPLPNWLSVMQYTWQKVSRSGNPQRTMTPDAQGEFSQSDYTEASIPIYATVDHFSLHDRLLQVSQRAGQPLDTAQIADKTRRVNEWVEDASINSGNIQVGTHASPGLLTAPNVNTFQYTGGAVGRAWDDATKTGEHILEDVLAMAQIEHDDNKPGPYELWINSPYDFKLNQDFKSATSGTIRSRLEELKFGGRNLTIHAVDQMPANRTSLVQVTDDVCDIIIGDRPRAITWTMPPGFVHNGMVLACMCPRYKDDSEGNSGIVLGNVT